MRSLIKLTSLLTILISVFITPSIAQSQESSFNLDAVVKFNGKLEHQALLESEKKMARAMEVMQDNEYIFTGLNGQYLSKSLMVDGLPLDFAQFNLLSMGMLSVTNGQVAGREIAFYVYLKRDGRKVLIPGFEKADLTQKEMDLEKILKQAKSGDYLVIEPVNKGEGSVSVLKLLGLGC